MLKKISKITHNFIEFNEISRKEFIKRRNEAWNNYDMYKMSI